jgi:hypothetical protein
MVGKLLGEAKADVLLVDPYANEKITDFAVTAPESTTVRILTTEQYSAGLNAAAERWVQQYSKTRRPEIRVLDRKRLHDRLIIIDGATAWSLPQSFKEPSREVAHNNRADSSGYRDGEDRSVLSPLGGGNAAAINPGPTSMKITTPKSPDDICPAKMQTTQKGPADCRVFRILR